MQFKLIALVALTLSSQVAAVTLRGVSQPKITNASSLDIVGSNLQSASDVVADECPHVTAMASTTVGQPSAACQQKHCMPQCRYQCTDPQCDQECTPECLAPECQTRCPSLKGMSMFVAGCKITCVKPVCEVVCPERHCGAGGCAECKTVCQRPSCKVACPDAGCQEVCKEPKCKFNCNMAKEQCAQPECHMSCDQSDCLGAEDGLPPLTQGMVIVDAVSPESLNLGKGFLPGNKANAPAAAPAGAPAAFIQTGARTITRSIEVKKVVAVPGQEELQLVSSVESLPLQN